MTIHTQEEKWFQDMPPQTMPPWHADYFELKELKKQQVK